MRRLSWLPVVLVGLLLLVGCAPGDPLPEDFYTKNIYPGTNATYDVGGIDNWYADGYFTNLYVGGVPLSTPAYGEIYITIPIATECTLADTYYLVAGTTTSDELKDFTASNERLIYTGVGSRVVLVVAAISVSSDTVNTVLGTKVYINGGAHEASFIQRKIATAGDVGAFAIATLVTLTTNDYVEIYIASSRAGAEITFNCMSLTVTSVD